MRASSDPPPDPGPPSMSTPDAAIHVLGAAAIACAVAVLAIGALLRTGLAHRVLDRPNDRSMHATPIPRIGGVGVLAGLLAAAATTVASLPAPVWAALAIVAAVSAVDDLRGLPAGLRLPLHLAAAAVATAGAVAAAGWLAAAAVALAVAWMLNLYNFMDGSDALAGTMAVTGFGGYALLASLSGDTPFSAACGAVAGAAAGFLVFNRPPARIFMGDLGSTSLGLLAGAIGVLGVDRGLWSPWVPPMLFMPFLLDASATLADRALRGARVWEAHREHAYQKLNLGGFGHRRTAAVYAALMAASAAAAVAASRAGVEAVACAALAAAHGALWWRVRRDWARRAARA